VDIVELLTGENPHLSFYSIVRKGDGLDIKRREGFKYEHLGYRFKSKIAEPFLVTAPYMEEEQNKPIELSTHEGQEFDFILKGTMKAQMENHVEILHEGDSMYYNSGRGHGMIATGGEECVFLAVVLRKPEQLDQEVKE
jgi:quercetin dioxygenase-like cupin family protein